MAKVLVVDSIDDHSVRMRDAFGAAGHRAHTARSGREALRLVEKDSFDLVTTDWMLADMTGIELVSAIRHLRDGREVRVFIVAGNNRADIQVRAFESGVDDFVAKSDDVSELLARASAALRRPAAIAANGLIRVGPVSIDKLAHKVVVRNREITLAPVEYRLMSYFLENSGRVLDRRQLLEKVWKRSAGIGERTVDVHVRRLRAALEPHKCEHLLQTVRGFGYRFG